MTSTANMHTIILLLTFKEFYISGEVLDLGVHPLDYASDTKYNYLVVIILDLMVSFFEV